MPLPWLPPVVIGCWQLARGHGRDVEDGMAVLEAYADAGFTAFDGADIYTGVEELLGDFVAAHGLARRVRIHTKMVPDLADLPTFDAAAVGRAVDRSLARLRSEAIDLVQFHWWDLNVPGYLPALAALAEEQRAGRVRAIGLTNFGAAQLAEIAAAGLPIASLQVQASLLDRRSGGAFADTATRAGIDLLAYGSVAGGLLSDAYLGAPQPEAWENRSLVKYEAILAEIGGWASLQDLLRALRRVADRHDGDVASVASAYALTLPGVRAVIVGARSRRHVAAHARLLRDLRLDASDVSLLETARGAYPEVPGGVYDLERDRSGRHGRIMKYGLNAGGSR
jgi:aryl-alcohol dehydrogenase-like predicted oxidoreductase